MQERQLLHNITENNWSQGGCKQVKPFLSIIVPVYNVEHFLGRCLDSLSKQTMQEIEVLMVNDGSTDGSREIAAAYALRDNRFRLIDQDNQGLSGARNKGLGAASGEYVAFVDSDDWVAPDMFAVMYAEAERSQADICACDYALAYEDRSEPDMLKLDRTRIEIEEYGLDRLWNSKKYAVVVWNKIYRRSIIAAHRLNFESNRNVFSEDVLFNLFFLRHAKVFASVPDTFYYYFQRPNSLTSTRKPNYMRRELYLVDRFVEFYADYRDRDVYNRILNRLFFERVQNSCVHDVEYKVAVSETKRELLQASTYPGFEANMKAVSEDREVWKPMRMFAFLCLQKKYTAAVLLLRALAVRSRVASFVKSRSRNRQYSSA